MSLTVEAKRAVVTEVAAVAKTAQSAVAAEYRGLTVAEIRRGLAELKAGGIDPASKRQAVTELIRILKLVHGGDHVSFDGEVYEVDDDEPRW